MWDVRLFRNSTCVSEINTAGAMALSLQLSLQDLQNPEAGDLQARYN